MNAMANSRRTVAVITGANAGIGYALAERLLKKSSKIHLCLACRNKARAEEAADKLKQKFPDADVDIVLLDTSSVASVHRAAAELRNRYDHIDYLYLNAGMMKVTGVDWGYFWRGLFSSRVFYMFATGEGLLVHEDEVTDDGLQGVFETNLFGHYVLVKELEDRLGSSASDRYNRSQLIWTSSSNATRKNFSMEDLQHEHGKDPYSSSKFAMDILSVGLNDSMNKRNVYSHVVCPGLVMTNLTYGILPAWFWTLIMPFICLLRIFVPGMTYSAPNGAEALVWLSTQDPVSLDPQVKYQSFCGVTGHSYVNQEKMSIGVDEGQELIKKLDEIDESLQKKCSKN
ncbi:3-keto-steroid reductase/17-beta-hydroxysteroid dehydrogenase 7 [Aplysia californica]|uniref:3-keto-steroid reductase/17-beta-hydroxysteroid dehydrogenase 7 n=1 Tax=Aplysia californica TaxID=6500 RepID=A0ABM0JQU4_APLCA|nr:3-keto-steroid reductase/17-beta-hydroxysteroid dehydrogenase 7 [Aplysia californica]